MMSIKIVGIIFIGIFLNIIIASAGWYLQITPEIFFLPGSIAGVIIGLMSFKFILDVIYGDL
jgi:hypothetical protein